MAYTVVIPALKRMDHCKPVIEYVREVVNEEKPEIHVVFVPLMESIRGNLVKFVDDWFEPKHMKGPKETCVVWPTAIEDEGLTWHDAWRNWITSVEYLTKGTHLSQIFIALSAELPNGIILASATSALSVPHLKLIELPVGYDLSIRRDEFAPASPLMKQITQYPTWGDADVSKPLLTVASKPKTALTLCVIRKIAENQHGDEILTDRPVSRTQISDALLERRRFLGQPRRVTTEMLGNRLATLKENDLIGKCWENKDGVHSPLSFHLTPEGVNISGLLRNAWEHQL